MAEQTIDYNFQIKNTPFVSVTQYGAIGDGTADDTVSIQNAINTGANVFIPAGTYKITSALNGESNQMIFGAGIGATTINQISVADAFTYTNVSRFTLKSLSIHSLGHCIHIVDSSSFILYPQFEDIEITAIGDAHIGIWFDVQVFNNIYFPSLKNIIINGGSPSPNVGTRIGISWTTTQAAPSGTVAPAIIGGRLTNLFVGMNIGAVGSIMSYGTSFDGITNDNTNLGNGTAIALSFTGPTGSNFFTNARFESTPAIDVYVNFSSQSSDNYIQCVASLANTTRWVDNGIRNSWYGLDGSVSNAQINHMWYPMLWESPQTFNNITTFEQADNSINAGGTIADNAKFALPAIVNIKAPNSNWGFPLAIMGDSQNRAFAIMEQNFSASTNTGQGVAFYANGRVTPVINGGNNQAPLILAALQVDSNGGFASDAMTLNGLLTGSVTWNIGALAINGAAQTSVTVTHAAVGDIAYASLSQVGANQCEVTAICGAGVVYVTIMNLTGASWTPGSGTVKVIVFKF